MTNYTNVLSEMHLPIFFKKGQLHQTTLLNCKVSVIKYGDFAILK